MRESHVHMPTAEEGAGKEAEEADSCLPGRITGTPYEASQFPWRLQ